MGHSGIVELIYRILPVPAWKTGLARHMESCPACSKRLAGREDVRRVLVQARDLGGLDDIWPAVRKASGIAAGEKPSAERPRRGGVRYAAHEAPAPRLLRWAAAMGGLAAAAVLLVGTIRYFEHPGARGAGNSMAETGGFILHSARIENEPANTYIIHPKNNGMVVVWVEKSL